MLFWFEHLQYPVLDGHLQPQWPGRRSARRRTGSRFRYAPSAASAADLCFVAGFYRRIFTLPAGHRTRPPSAHIRFDSWTASQYDRCGEVWLNARRSCERGLVVVVRQGSPQLAPVPLLLHVRVAPNEVRTVKLSNPPVIAAKRYFFSSDRVLGVEVKIPILSTFVNRFMHIFQVTKK